MSDEFVHLHVHSQYSLLDGAVKVKDLVKRVAAGGMKGVAVTDHGNMFGAIALYKAAKEAKVQAILGCELDIAARVGHTTEPSGPGAAAARATHLPVLAATNEGYKNLIWLVSRAHVSGAPLPLEDIAAHAKGLVVMTGCMGGFVPQAILEEGEGRGRQALAALRDALEPGSLYVELQDHGLPEQPVLNDILVRLAKEMELPLVATNDVHYAERSDAEAHLYLSCIKTGRSLDEAKERHHGSSEMFLKSPGEMAQTFSAHPEALRATIEIAEKCSHLKLKLGEPMLPSFKVPEGYDTEGYFRHVAHEGLERRFEEMAAQGKHVDREAYKKRLEIELDVIAKMKFPGYFLIVWDFIRHAKENGIPVGPGRGSGAGSIVAYSMRITDLDPIPYALLFERFLNPERVSMPDFDVDFCMDRRDQVIAYVQSKYGETSVGQIATFAELKSKSVVKDVARCLGITPVEAQQIANLIPRKTPAETYTISESLGIEPKLKKLYDEDARIRELLDQARKLEGLTRHAGKHAAGIVISEGPLWDHVPVFRDEKSNALVTQYYKEDVEQAGLVKFDFLGLKTLTVLDIAVRHVNARPDHQAASQATPGHREGKKLDLSRIPMDDAATYKLLASGETKGVFQLESDGMQKLFKDLKADSFEDIVAAVALYRPGPMGAGMHEDFVRRKHGLAPIASLHPLIDEIVKPTYGVIVYQEQVMQIAQKLAGYSLGGADLLRRAMGKKKPEEMAKQKGIFLEGAAKNGVDQGEAERIFGLLEYFAGYGFNKCVVGETLVVDAITGERATVADLFATRRPFVVHALGEDGKLRPRAVERVMRNGRKRVFELRTAQGKRIVATANHPFRTLDGWKNLAELRVGDRIAAPRQMAVPTTDSWPQHEVVALAGLLSEGNTCHPTCLYFFGNDRVLVDDFARAAACFPESVPRVYQRTNGKYEVCVSTGRDRRFAAGHVPWNARVVGSEIDIGAAQPTLPARSGMFEWARSLGILGRKATEKTVPPGVFRLCDADLEVFLGRLWAGDGFLASKMLAVPFYATSSPGLARDVQALLLRLGIQSGVHTKSFRYRGRSVPGYTVHLVGEGSVETFLERVAPHCVGRDKQLALLRRHVESTERGKTSKDTIPREVRAWVDDARCARSLTWKELERLSGVSTREMMGRGSPSKTGFRRATIRALGEFLGSRRLLDAASSDVFWDRIVSIEPRGIEETYDLTVETDHNFVADGLIVHNSHSAAYALITYQTAWLKAHYPVELLCAILTSDKDRIDKVVRTIADARSMGVTVLPPDVNESDTDFKVVYTHPEGNKALRRSERIKDVLGPQIRFGLGAVRGLGGAALEAVFEARRDGAFRDLFDLAARVDAKRVNKAVFEALVQCGAFDTTLGERGITRARAFASIDIALERSRAASRDREAGQTSMFGLFDAAPQQASAAPSAGDYVECEPWDRREMLVREKQSLGFYVSGHPLERYLKGEAALAKLDADPIADCAGMEDWAQVKLAGMVEGYRERIFKDGGGKIAFFELEDLTGRVNVKVRAREIDQFAAMLTAGEPVLVEGKVSFPQRGEDEPDEPEGPREPTILLNAVRPLADAVRADTRAITIRVRAERTRATDLAGLARVLTSAKGNCPVALHVSFADGAEAVLTLGESWRVDVGDGLLSGIERIFGEQVAELR